MRNLEKRQRPLGSERHKTEQRSGPDHVAGLAYDPKSWAAGVWTPKSDKIKNAIRNRGWHFLFLLE